MDCGKGDDCNYKRFIFKGLIKNKYTGKNYHYTAHSVSFCHIS